MKKNILSLFFCILLCFFCIPLPTSATLQDIQYVVDNADILSDAEHIELNSIAKRISESYSIDVFIMTTSSLDDVTAQEYAESLYDDTDANWTGGYWKSEDTILLLLALNEREWYISTAGDAIYVYTDYGLEYLGDIMIPYLSEGSYFDGFSAYLALLPDYFEAYQKGTPIDGYASDYNPLDAQDNVYYEGENEISIVLSIIIGLITSLIAILVMRGQMNTKHRQHSAGDYMRPGSYQLKQHSDLFLYSSISKVRRQENNNSGGGSSVHKGSGGTRHGGRGGKF